MIVYIWKANEDINQEGMWKKSSVTSKQNIPEGFIFDRYHRDGKRTYKIDDEGLLRRTDKVTPGETNISESPDKEYAIR